MPTAPHILQSAVNRALEQFDLTDAPPEVLQVVPATNPQFGDYQFNGALPLAKLLKTNPRQLATQIVEKLQVGEVAETPEIAGPGFINFRLKREWVENATREAMSDPRLGVPPDPLRRRIILDYPSPNVAKPLHVGHIPATFIGDAIARLLRFQGHEVISDNHIGDWGTPIGKVIVGWKKYLDQAAFEKAPLDEMGRLYALVNAQCESDPAVQDEARSETAKLQRGDEENRAIWKTMRESSQGELDALYQRLGIYIDETLGESFYQPMLEGVLTELQDEGIAVESQGALIIPFDEPEQLRDKPMLVRKSDGSALYATTDLATVKYRVERWAPDEIIYTADVRQTNHFQQLFTATRKWGFENIKLRHISWGAILGENGRPISTRAGVTSKLTLLIEEAQNRALAIAREKSPELDDERAQEIARVLGIGAIKYAELSPNRSSDYQFSWEKMLSLTGNSAVYLEYAYVRTRSIAREAVRQGVTFSDAPQLVLELPTEQELAKFLLRFNEAIDAVLADYRPHLLCDYLYELAGKFAGFYRDCPVLKSESPVRESRLALTSFAGDVLKQGLNLLGIETIEQM